MNFPPLLTGVGFWFFDIWREEGGRGEGGHGTAQDSVGRSLGSKHVLQKQKIETFVENHTKPLFPRHSFANRYKAGREDKLSASQM